MALWSLVTNKLGFMLTAYCSPSPPHSAQAQIQYIAAYQGAGKLQLSFLYKKNVKWEIQSNTCPVRTVRCCHGKPSEGSMPHSIQEFLIIMHLKLLHYCAFKKNFFVPYSPWPFALCTFRNFFFVLSSMAESCKGV